jgi:hypothetical protein
MVMLVISVRGVGVTTVVVVRLKDVEDGDHPLRSQFDCIFSNAMIPTLPPSLPLSASLLQIVDTVRLVENIQPRHL